MNAAALKTPPASPCENFAYFAVKSSFLTAKDARKARRTQTNLLQRLGKLVKRLAGCRLSRPRI